MSLQLPRLRRELAAVAGVLMCTLCVADTLPFDDAPLSVLFLRIDAQDAGQLGVIGEDGQGLWFYDLAAHGEVNTLSAADWSPHGDTIVFSLGVGEPPINYLFTMDADGDNVQQLTGPGSGTEGDYHPAWSPDGEHIAFIRDTGPLTVVVIDKDGSDPTPVGGGLGLAYPDWSQDGDFLSFTVLDVGSGKHAITVRDFDAGSNSRLTGNTTDDTHASWSADRDEVIYVAGGEGVAQIVAVDTAGANPATLLQRESFDGLEWSPDNDSIVFATQDSGGSGLFTMDTEGGNVLPLTTPPFGSYDADCTWSPGNHRVHIQLQDASNGAAIQSAEVLCQWPDRSIGFPVVRSAVTYVIPPDSPPFRSHLPPVPGDPIFSTGAIQAGEYNYVVFAPGYLPKTGAKIDSTAAGEVVSTIELTPDDGLLQTNALDLEIRVLNDQGQWNGQNLLTDAIDFSQGGQPLSPAIGFLRDSVRVFGLPSGKVGVSVTSDEFIVAGGIVTFGTGERKSLVLTAERAVDNQSPSRAGGTVPGIVTGYIFDVTADPIAGMTNGMAVAENVDSNIAVFTYATTDGAFVLPDVTAGNTELLGFSPDGSFVSDPHRFALSAGEVYGDEPQSEDTDLEIEMGAFDSDGDALDDAWEIAHGLDETNPFGDNGADGDLEPDGLTNLQEYIAGTDPNVADTDVDGFGDGQEAEVGADPDNSADQPEASALVWVDFGYLAPDGIGTLGKPFATIDDAVALTAPGGTLRIKGDVSTTATGIVPSVLSTPLTIEAWNGPVRVGAE